jgi:hypothetical protein
MESEKFLEDQVEPLHGMVLHGLGAVVADVNAQFSDNLNSPRFNWRPHPGGDGFSPASELMVHQAVCHLAAAGIIYSEKQDAYQTLFSTILMVKADWCCLSFSVSRYLRGFLSTMIVSVGQSDPVPAGTFPVSLPRSPLRPRDHQRARIT